MIRRGEAVDVAARLYPRSILAKAIRAVGGTPRPRLRGLPRGRFRLTADSKELLGEVLNAALILVHRGMIEDECTPFLRKLCGRLRGGAELEKDWVEMREPLIREDRAREMRMLMEEARKR
jgi:hypothetical protein